MQYPPTAADGRAQERLCARLIAARRGFDLGDDDRLHAWLSPLWRSGSLAPQQRWVLAAVCVRQRRWGEALEVLDALERDGDVPGEARYLRAVCLVADARPGEALELLAAPTRGVPEAWRAHLRGQAHEVAGDLGAALDAMREGQRLDGTELVRWADLARCCERARDHRGALDAWDQVLARAKADPDASYGRVASLAALGMIGEAAAALQSTVLLGEQASRALDDPRLAALRDLPAFGVAQQLAGRPDPAWTGELAEWIPSVLSDARVVAAGVRPVARHVGAQHDRLQRKRYRDGSPWSGVLWPDGLWDLCREEVAPSRLVAVGPGVRDRDGIEHPLHWYLDRRSDQLVLAFGAEAPAALRVDAGRTAESLLDVLGRHHPRPWLGRSLFPRCRRALAGHLSAIRIPDPYTGELDRALPHVLDRHWSTSPFVDRYAWGSVRQDDPWPERIPPQRDLASKAREYAQEVRQQADGGRCRHTRRTLFSGSWLTLELHDRRLWVWEVRYVPAADGAVIDRLATRCGVDLPRDLPLDVVGALLGFGWTGAEALEARVATDPVAVAAEHLHALAAVGSDGVDGALALAAFTRREEPAVRDALVAIAERYNWEFLLEELLLSEADVGRRRAIRDLLDGGIAEPRYDEHGDPVDLLAEEGA